MHTAQAGGGPFDTRLRAGVVEEAALGRAGRRMRMGPLRQDRRKIGVGSKERSRFPGRPHLSFMQRQRRAHQHAAAPEKLEKLESKVRRDSGRGGRGKGAVSIEDSSPAAASQKRCMLCFGRVRVSLDRRRVERALDELLVDLGRRRDSEQQRRG